MSASASETAPATEYNSSALNARDLEWAKNPPDVLAKHQEINGSIVRTRFPPEPNGYLHIGHAKSMNMNFRLAFEKLGVPTEHRRTIFRYDDTNPDAESAEYIDSLRRDLDWLGWKPERTTYSSDNFEKLHEFAVQLIHKKLAYVCDMTKDEMVAQRELAMKRANARSKGLDPDVEAPIPSPDILPGRNRETSVERNLELFDKMRLGFFPEGSYTLRLKMDFESPNPNMYDLVAYRIKYTAHPHAGSGWCIYPSYDWTHGICDSLEEIDYSICTLEFETRREPYYWILQAVNLFRPQVYEMSRLNLQYTVLSKRKLIHLVTHGIVRGWDDPRMPTVSGLRRRGYTADILNSFCQDIGATRAENVVEISKLEQTARVQLAATSRRAMAALDPIKVEISNFKEIEAASETLTFDVLNIATDEAAGTHSISLTSTIYIDSTDFRLEDDPNYYGLAPGKAVGLKYHGGNLVCDEAVKDPETGKVSLLKCYLDASEYRSKPKTHISWVPSNSLKATVRVYKNLFTVPEPSDLWQDEINPESETVYPEAFIDPSAAEVIDASKIDKWHSNVALQFERFGYFVADYETTFDGTKGDIVFNRTVSLKEELGKKVVSAEEQAAAEARRNKTKQALLEKEERMQIPPEKFFQDASEFKDLYSQFDDTGLPSHDKDGQPLSKSMKKKLEAKRKKHISQVKSWNKQNS